MPRRAATAARGRAAGLEQPPAAAGISVSVPSSVASMSEGRDTAQASAATRKKPGTIFFITVELDESTIDVHFVREDFLSYFDNVVTFCIAVENSKRSDRVSKHLHAFLEFSVPVYVAELREYVDIVMNGAHIDVQASRSKKSTLKYISKEDLYLLFNCKSSELHFNYRVYEWATSIAYFDYTHPFVVEHRFCYQYLRKYYIDHCNKALVGFGGFRPYEYLYANWADRCIIWWNNIIKNYEMKDRQLYLHGRSNIGKTSLIEKLIGRNNMKYCFYPGVGKFFMQSYNPVIHKVILFEEFDLKLYEMSMLKRLLEGRAQAYPVKCETDKIITHRGPIIFVSNLFPGDFDQALLNRLLLVNADTPYWEGLCLPIPKEEGEISGRETEDTVDSVFVSSDSES